MNSKHILREAKKIEDIKKKILDIELKGSNGSVETFNLALVNSQVNLDKEILLEWVARAIYENNLDRW